MSKLLEKATDWLDSKPTICGKLMVTRQVAALLVVITFIFKSFSIPLGTLLDTDFTSKSFLNYPMEGALLYLLILVPIIYIIVYNLIRVKIEYTRKANLIMGYTIVGDALDGLWTLYYLFISVCYFERYRVIGMQTEADNLVTAFSIFYLLLTFFLLSYNENHKFVSRALREDCSTPFCDSDGKPIYDGDHVYCNGLEYRFYRVKAVSDNDIDTWTLEPLYEKSLSSSYKKILELLKEDEESEEGEEGKEVKKPKKAPSHLTLADALLSKDIEVKVKNDLSHRIREKAENFE